MTRARRVAISGLGVVSAVGCSAPEFFASVVSGRSGVRRLPWREDTVAATVDFDADSHFSRMQLTTLDRYAQFALVAAQEAIGQAGIEADALSSSRAGVYFGSGVGGAQSLEGAYRSFHSPGARVGPMTVLLAMANAATANISLRYAIRGPTLTYSVACASAAVAIGEAFRALRDGYLDIALVGGSEALLHPGMVAAWNAMRVLAVPDPERPERSCRPFAADRSGLVLGEGAGVLVLESLEHLRARRGEALAEIAGYGVTSDATHLAKPDVDGQAAAMGAALADAGLEPSGIGYVNAHGTATPVGDAVETRSIRAVFGPAAETLAVSSTKALHGHLLGASGAVELIATVMALRARTLPPTMHLDRRDPECDLDYIANHARHSVDCEAAISNSFAFGGTNAVLVVRQPRSS